MTHDKDFKRLVRRRMRKTGESYMSARAHLQRALAAGGAASERSGEVAVYPFERFTDSAKRALTRAHFEAEVGNSQSIATTHLLLGLLHDRNTTAVGVAGRLAPGLLRLLLRDQAGIRQAIGRQPAKVPVRESAGMVPSEPVKRAMEFAFAEAQMIGDGRVGTGHLLVGMLRVETSSGARVMAELGVTADGARAKLRELIESRAVPESSTPPRGLRSELMPVTEFTDTLHDLLQRFERETGTPTTLVADASWPSRMAERTAHHLLRIVEETLQNVCQHSGARSVKVTLEGVGGEALLTVQDDGRGLQGLSEGRGYHIAGMHRYAGLAGCSLRIQSLPDRGTTVKVSFPEQAGPWTVVA